MKYRSSVSSRSFAPRVGGQRNLLVGRNEADDQLLAKSPCGIRADLIGEPARRDAQQPAARVVGPALAGHWVAAAMSASWTASSQPAKSR